jgi:hypothetical protein
MARIVQFPRSLAAPSGSPPADGVCGTLLFFTGVRYQRHDDDMAAVPKRRKRASNGDPATKGAGGGSLAAGRAARRSPRRAG